ncbi:LapB repeat-containing protein [Listeria seeligeri]|uniref:SdrD B-like domain-containing protein n=2 Tax=Listeria seeligeri TaxID=1640 RepID=UPI00162AE050|nr:SdrD B-like domain-containing protein [Listeria seeligeri]MBC1725949.1 LapB repeat-containing protein [Listeria seeligeri]
MPKYKKKFTCVVIMLLLLQVIAPSITFAADTSDQLQINLKNPDKPIKKDTTFYVTVKSNQENTTITLPDGVEYKEFTENQNFKYDSVHKKINITSVDTVEIPLQIAEVGEYNLVLKGNKVESAPLKVIVPAEKSLNKSSDIQASNAYLDLEVSASKTVLNADDSSDTSKLIFNMTHLDSESTLKDGKLVIDLSNTKLDIVDGSYPTKSDNIKSTNYDSVTRELTVTFVDGISGQFDFPILVKPGTAAVSGETYIVKSTFSGEATSGNDYGEVEQDAPSISITGVVPEYTPATPESIIGWPATTATAGSWNATGYNGESLNQYIKPAAGDALYFSDLRIEKVYNVSGHWSDAEKFSAIKIDGIFLGTIVEQNDYHQVIDYGEQTLTTINLQDKLTIPLDATPGVYTVDYNIYNGSEFLYTTTKTTTVKESSTVATYVADAAGSETIGQGDKASIRYKLNIRGGPNLPEKISITYKVPDGVQPTLVGSQSNTSISKLEYEVNNSGTWQESNSLDLSGIKQITRIRISFPDGNLTPAAYGRIEYANTDNLPGNTIHFETESVSYQDTFGVMQNLVTEDPSNAKFNIPVQVVDNAPSNAPSNVSSAIYNSDFPTNPIYNGATFNNSIRIGATGGKPLEKPYVFLVIPAGFTAETMNSKIASNMITGVDLTDSRLPNYSVDSSPSIANTVKKKVLSDGSTLCYLLADNTSIQGTTANIEYLMGNIKVKAENAYAGDYVFKYGVGSLTDDNYNLFNANGMTEEILPNEIQQAIGANNNRYLSTSKTLTMGDLNNISVKAQVKGSKDADWINGTTSTAKSLPGEAVDYKYTLTNNGTASLNNFEYVNILPYLGDTFITSEYSRGSQFEVKMTDNVLVGLNGASTGYTIEYSTSNTPSRFDRDGNDVPGDVWTVTPPADITTVRAIRIKLTEALRPGDEITLAYRGKLPDDAPRNGEVASNTVAYRGEVETDGSTVEKVYELPKTNVSATTPVNDGELTGTVYQDLNKDGSENSAENGFNGVTVDLVQANDPTTIVKSIVTMNDGAYSFSDLPYDKYKVRVTLPENASFITTGANGLSPDQSNPKYAWVTKNGKTEFTLSDISSVGNKSISNLDAPLFVYTPLKGSVTFVDKDNLVIPSSYGKDYKVELRNDNGEKISTTTANQEGNYTFSELDIEQVGNYQLTFIAPEDSELVFAPNNPDSTGRLNIHLTPGIGIDSGDISDIYVTDIDTPTASITFNASTTNPTLATINVADASTDTTTTWEIKNESGNIVYSGNGTTVSDQLSFLKNDKLDGVYKLITKTLDAAKNEIEVQSEFKIMTTDPTLTLSKNTTSYEIGDKIPSNSDYQNIFGATATDSFGEPLEVIFDDSAVNYHQPGSYVVKVIATDTGGNQTEQNATILVQDTTPPEIFATSGTNFAKPILLNTNTTDYKNLTEKSLFQMAGVYATDNYNDTTKAGAILSGPITFTSDFAKAKLIPSKQGTIYEISVNAKDTMDNQTTVPVKLYVKIIDNHSPTFQVLNQTYRINNPVTEESFLQAAIVDLSDDYDTKGKIKITSNFDTVVNFNKAGNYTVTVSAFDTSGNVSSNNVIVKVQSQEIPIITGKSSDKLQMNSRKMTEQEWIKRLNLKASSSDYPNIPISLTGEETINLNKAGKYKIYANAVDVNGNKAEPFEIIITINDDTTKKGENTTSGDLSLKENSKLTNHLPNTGDASSLFWGIVGLIAISGIVILYRRKRT